MPALATSLQLLASGGGIKLYSYHSIADAEAAMKAADYFAPASQVLNPGDRIFCTDNANAHFDVVVNTVTPASPPDVSPPTAGHVAVLSIANYA